MKDFLGSIPLLLVLYFSIKWIYKTYIKIPQEDKKIGLYKFNEFSVIKQKFNVNSYPRISNENCLCYREQISNGVQVIGFIDYSINDYIPQPTALLKEHNYFFKVEAKVGNFEKVFKSGTYLSEFNENTCIEEISKLKSLLNSNTDFNFAIKSKQLR